MVNKNEIIDDVAYLHKNRPHLFTILFSGSEDTQLWNKIDSCFQPGECVDSYHLSSDYTTDEYECLETCDSQPDCKWFTFFPQLSYCELLHNCSSGDLHK